MRGNPLFIVNDEVDAASLNTMINKNSKSSINRYLDDIKAKSACSVYLQVLGHLRLCCYRQCHQGGILILHIIFNRGTDILEEIFSFRKRVLETVLLIYIL